MGRTALIRPAAVGIAALSVALCAGALVLLWLGPAHHPYNYDISGDLVVGSLFPLAGALIAVREPGNRCSWVLLSTGRRAWPRCWGCHGVRSTAATQPRRPGHSGWLKWAPAGAPARAVRSFP